MNNAMHYRRQSVPWTPQRRAEHGARLARIIAEKKARGESWGQGNRLISVTSSAALEKFAMARRRQQRQRGWECQGCGYDAQHASEIRGRCPKCMGFAWEARRPEPVAPAESYFLGDSIVGKRGRAA